MCCAFVRCCACVPLVSQSLRQGQETENPNQNPWNRPSSSAAAPLMMMMMRWLKNWISFLDGICKLKGTQNIDLLRRLLIQSMCPVSLSLTLSSCLPACLHPSLGNFHGWWLNEWMGGWIDGWMDGVRLSRCVSVVVFQHSAGRRQSASQWALLCTTCFTTSHLLLPLWFGAEIEIPNGKRVIRSNWIVQHGKMYIRDREPLIRIQYLTLWLRSSVPLYVILFRNRLSTWAFDYYDMIR